MTQRRSEALQAQNPLRGPVGTKTFASCCPIRPSDERPRPGIPPQKTLPPPWRPDHMETPERISTDPGGIHKKKKKQKEKSLLLPSRRKTTGMTGAHNHPPTRQRVVPSSWLTGGPLFVESDTRAPPPRRRSASGGTLKVGHRLLNPTPPDRTAPSFAPLLFVTGFHPRVGVRLALMAGRLRASFLRRGLERAFRCLFRAGFRGAGAGRSSPRGVSVTMTGTTLAQLSMRGDWRKVKLYGE